MDVVTHPATSSFVLPVDVQKVQVSFPIPEIGCEGSVRISKHVSVVTAETKLILVGRVRNILAGREFLGEKFFIRAAVRIVTWGARPILDRPVQHGHALRNDIFVTAKTDVLAFAQQKFWMITGMR